MVGGKSKNAKKIEQNVLTDTMKRFNDSWTYQKDNWHEKWDRDNKLYDNERVRAAYEGTTDTFVPMSFSTVETLVSAMVNASLRFAFKSGDPLVNNDDKPFNALINEWWDEDQWDLAIEEGSRETFTTGMAGNFVYWDGESDQPRMETYAMRDMIVDPAARKPSDLQKRGSYAGRRYFVNKGQLDDVMVIDADEESKTYGELVPRFKKTPETEVGGDKGEPDDKELKEMFSNSTLSTAKDDQDEVIEIWDVDRVVTIKNRRHVIEDVENPYKQRHEQLLFRKYLEEAQAATYDPEMAVEALKQAAKEAQRKSKADSKGIVPFWFMRNYRKVSLLYANSEINAIAKQQEFLNDMTNMESDAIIKKLAPQKELDPDYAEYIDLITDEPGVAYPFRPGSLVDRQTDQIPYQMFNNRINVKNEMRETTAMDQITKGVSNANDATATEVKAQLSQSGQRIQSKARIFEKDGFYWFGWILMKLSQLYINEPVVVSVPGGATITPEEAMERYGIELPDGAGIFDPADFQDDVRVRVSLDVDHENKKVEIQREATMGYQMLIQDPTNNLEAAKRIFYPKMFNIDQEDLDAIMTPNPQQQMPMGMPGMQPQGPGGMPGAPGTQQMPQQPQAPQAPPQPPQGGQG